MSTSLYLVNPRASFPTYFSADVFAASGFRPATAMADLAITTLAAFAPADVDVRLCDENISPLDTSVHPDVVGITGKITQLERMIEIARLFRRRGTRVVIGGPQASLCPESLADEADTLVVGEFENIAEAFFDDLRQGTLKSRYYGDKPDLDRTPIPRWDLYPNDRAGMGTVQTSRGCPFECEFCDVIEYLGRRQRHKTPPRVLAELDVLYKFGHRAVFLADDNFTVYRSRAKELLAALQSWNGRQQSPMTFTTQVSVDCARDPEMLQMCAAAELRNVFIGIETPNEGGLREAKKRQNVGIDLVERVSLFVRNGIAVTGGMIVGFDADSRSIFEQQYDFAMALPVSIFSVGCLVAPAATPIHRRLAVQNRLVADGMEVAGAPWSTNILPLQMTRAELIAGVQWLCNRLYRPEAFGHRMLRFIAEFGCDGGAPIARKAAAGQYRPLDVEAVALAGRVRQLGPAEATMVAQLQAATARKPSAAPYVILMLGQYMQVRHSFTHAGIWNPAVGARDTVPWEALAHTSATTPAQPAPLLSTARMR